MASALATALLAAPVIAHATTTDADGFMPRVGATSTDVAVFLTDCGARVDHHMTGFRGHSRFNPGSGLTQAVIDAQVLCVEMTEDGGLTAAFLGSDPMQVADSGGRFDARCGVVDQNGVVANPGVVTGMITRHTTGRDAEIRQIILRCATADNLDPVLGDQGSRDPVDQGSMTTQDCPGNQVATALKVRSHRSSGQMASVQMRCGFYPRPPTDVRQVLPGARATIDASDPDPVFTWTGSAQVHQVCVTVLERTCRSVTGRSTPGLGLIDSGAIGRRIGWSVRGCNGRAEGAAPVRACARALSTPAPADIGVLGIDVAPARPRAAVSRNSSEVASDGTVQINARWIGHVLTNRYVLTVSGTAVAGVVRRIPEPSEAGGSHLETLTLPVIRRRATLDVRVQACADGVGAPAGREVCGTKIPLRTLFVDGARKVCSFAATKRVGKTRQTRRCP